MPLNDVVVTVVIVASAVVTIVTTFSSASSAIFMVYRILRPENEAPALAPRLGRRDVLPPPIQEPSPEGGSSASAILPRIHGFFRRQGGVFYGTSPRQVMSMLAAVCHLISATTSLMSASDTVRQYWRRFARSDGPRRTVRVRGGAERTYVSVATSPVSSTTTLSPIPSQTSVSHLLDLKNAIESAITYTDQGVKLRLGTRNCNKVACKPSSLKRKLSLLYNKHSTENKRDSRHRQTTDRHRMIATGVFNVAEGVLQESELQMGEYADQARKVIDDALTAVNVVKDAERYDNFAMTLGDQARLALREHDAIVTIQEGNEESENSGVNRDSPRADYQLLEDNASGIFQELFQKYEVGQKIEEYLPDTEELKDRIHEIVKSIEDVRQEYTENIEGIVNGIENLDAQRAKNDYRQEADNAWGMAQEVIRQFDVGEELGGYIEQALDKKDNALSYIKSAEKVLQEYGENAVEIITGFENVGGTQQDEYTDNNAWRMVQETIHETVDQVGERIERAEEFKDNALSIVTRDKRLLQEYNEKAVESIKGTENQGVIKKVRRHQKIDDNAVGMAENEHHANFGNQVRENQRSDEFKEKAHAEVKSDEHSEKVIESIKLTQNQGAIKKDKRYLKTNNNARGLPQDEFHETVGKQTGKHIERAEETKDNAHAVIKSAENVLQNYRDTVEENIKKTQNVYDSVKSELLENLDHLQKTSENTHGTSTETLLKRQIQKNEEEYLKYATEIKDKAYEVVRNVDELLQQNNGVKLKRRRRRKSNRRSLSEVADSRKNKEWADDDYKRKVIVCRPRCDRECSKSETRKDSGMQTSVETTDVGCSPSRCDKICYSCTHLDTANPNPYKMNDAKIKIESSMENINVILKELTKNSLIVIKKKRRPNRSECLLQKRKKETKSTEPLRPESAGARKREVGPRRRYAYRNSKNEFTSMATTCQTESSPEECKGFRYYEDRELIRSECSESSHLHSNQLSRHNRRREIDVIESIQHLEAENVLEGMSDDVWFTNKLAPLDTSIRWESQDDTPRDDLGSSTKFYVRKHCLTSPGTDKNRNILNTVSATQEKIHQTNQHSSEHQFEFNSNRHQIRIPPDTYVYRRFPQAERRGKACNVKFVKETTPCLIKNTKKTFKTPIDRDIDVTATYSSKEALSQRNKEIIQNIKKELGLCSNVDESELALPSPSQATNGKPHSYLRNKIVICKKRCQTNKVDWGKKYSERFKHLLSRIETGDSINKLVADVDEQLQRNEGKVIVAKSTQSKSPNHRSCEIIWRRDCVRNTPNPSAIEVNITHDYFQNKRTKTSGAKKYIYDSSNPKYNSVKSDIACGRLAALHLVIPPKFDCRKARNKCEARPHQRG